MKDVQTVDMGGEGGLHGQSPGSPFNCSEEEKKCGSQNLCCLSGPWICLPPSKAPSHQNATGVQIHGAFKRHTSVPYSRSMDERLKLKVLYHKVSFLIVRPLGAQVDQDPQLKFYLILVSQSSGGHPLLDGWSHP